MALVILDNCFTIQSATVVIGCAAKLNRYRTVNVLLVALARWLMLSGLCRVIHFYRGSSRITIEEVRG